MHDTLDETQVSILWRAAQEAMLTPEQLRSLSIANPYTLSGPVADKMRAAVSRIAPAQAQEWIAEAGTSMSLQAKAAQLGLEKMTPDLQAEISAFTPITPEQQRDARIEELKASLPWGSQGSYDEAGNFTPGKQPNLSAQLELEMLAPELAGSMKVAARPPVADGGMDQESANWVNDRLRSMQASGMGVIDY